MKLKSFKEKNNKKIGVILFTITCILLISGVILCRTFAIFETNDKYDVMNGSVEDPGDIYFAFYKDGVIQKEMPQKDEGYWLDEEKSYCGVLGKKDETMKPTLDRDTWSIVVTGMKTSRTKCNLYFIKTYDETTLFDLSGNKYNGTFKDGAKVQEDEEGNLGIYFDGINDYVDVDDLPESINWEDGFIIEGEFKVKSLNETNWKRIFDFGGTNEQEDNNILLALGNSKFGCNNFCVSFSVRYDQTNREKYVFDFFELEQMVKFKAEYTKLESSYTVKIIKNNKSFVSDIIDTTEFVKNIDRTSNYLGKSNWDEPYFNGYIYSLKITDSNDHVILWYDF